MASTSTLPRRGKKPHRPTPRASAAVRGEVLTSAEAAAYLRVAESQLVELATRHEIPGRQIGGEWRFSSAALANWLAEGPRNSFWETQFGALKDDPYLNEILHDVYRQRGRPMTEDA